jgi:hypothetical protein
MTENTSEQKEILLKVLNDPIIAAGGPYKKILQYLFDCYQKDFVPSEFNIATKVFSRDNNFNPNEDTVVRVNLYRLRKKLNEYYAGPGKSDELKILIPKGHHAILFTKNNTTTTWWKHLLTIKNILFTILTLILLFVIILLWIQNQDLKLHKNEKHNQVSQNIIWFDFVNSELNTSIVVGELFSFYLNKQEYSHEWLIRDDQINSYEELLAFIQQTNLNESNIYLPGWDIVPKSAASNLLYISGALSEISDRISVKITSEVTLDNLRTDNIIYIGHFHNLKHLNKYLPSLKFHPSTTYNTANRHPERHIRVTATGIDTLYQVIFQYDKKSALNSDYVLISKVPGPNNNIFLFIISFQPLGRLETIKILTQNRLYHQLLSEIQLITNNITPFFELLIEVKGYEEKGFETVVKHFFPLP